MKEQTGSPGAGNGNQMRPGSPGGQPDSGAAGRSRAFSERARSSAIEKTEEARDKAQRSLQEGREKIAQRVENLGSALRAGTDELSEDELLSRYIEGAAERVDRLASYMRSADPRDAVRDVEDLARRSPLVFYGAAFAIGLAAGRFLKSSGSRSPEGEETSSEPSFRSRREASTTSPGLGDQRPGFGSQPASSAFGSQAAGTGFSEQRPTGGLESRPIGSEPEPTRPTVPQPPRPASGEGPKFS